MSRPTRAATVEALARAVTDVGALLRGWRRDPATRAGAWDGSQFKAVADAMAHRELRDRLEHVEPGTPVLSEEDPAGLPTRRPDRYWLIDPIDGTASYAHGFPGYVTQAALLVAHRPVLAAIHAPELDVCYTADRTGAWANGRPLPPVTPAQPERGVLIDNTPVPMGLARAVQDRFDYPHYRECGSIALKLCAVAEGSAHLFVKDVPIRDWDVAAPELLLRRTGVALLRLDGIPFGFDGGYEHRGLVAASDPTAAAEIARWARAWRPPDG